ncbi:MAG: ATP-binding protein [Pseudomonadota bacterium]
MRERGHENALIAALEGVGDGIAYFDDDDRLRFWNQRFATMNAPIASLLEPGQRWELIVREMARRGVITGPSGQALVARALAAPDGGDRFALSHEDGASFVVAINPAPGDGFVVSWRDVSADRRAREAMHDAETMLERVLDACPAPVLMVRVDGDDILYSSPAWRRMFGRRDNVKDIYHNLADRADLLTELLAAGEVHEFELTLRNAKGAPFPGAVSAKLVEHGGEDVIVSTIIDLTWRRRSEAELARQTEMLHQSEKLSALGELLAGVSHELNNPLSLVVGQTMMLQEDELPTPTRRRVDKIAAAAERCARIVKTFLAMARQRPAQMAPVDLAETLEAALDVAAHGLTSNGARIDRRIAPDLPPVWADADQIAQVAVNLIVNAEQALATRGRNGKVTVSAWAEADTVTFEIADNGPGVPAEVRRRIFEPFFTTKALGKGTGVGLAFCHRVIHAHEGTIALTSDPGAGAAFRVTLKAAHTAHAPLAAAEAHTPTTIKRALVAEDEPDVADLISEILRRDGWMVDVASDGSQALAIAAEKHFDLVIADLRMPGIDGMGLLDELRQCAPDLARRFAFVTGDAMGPGAETALRHAGVPHLEKPVVPADLRALARRLAAEPVA